MDPATVKADGAAVAGPVLDHLSSGSEDAEREALALLRANVGEMGTGTIRRLQSDHEAQQVGRLQRLSRRIGTSKLVPGLTVHQAKGLEWPHVSVILTPNQIGDVVGDG